ncbi:MAG: hypothetical protein JNM09_21190 [Blastocatellia bacterium]|nr:hypothetical protein [Blastocatellia bacterium]
MKPHRFTFALILATCGMLSFSQAVNACTCASPRTVCEAFGSATAVFVGKAIGAKYSQPYKDKTGNNQTYLGGEIYFDVQEVFSGVKGQKRVTIHSGMGGGDCGKAFIKGETYLLYAYGKTDSLSTSICTRTRFIADANEDVDYLRHLPPEGVGARLYGEVSKTSKEEDADGRLKREGLTGIRIIIKSDRGETQIAETDQRGKYEITGLKSGKYRVEAELPDGYKRGEYKSEQEFSVQDRGCANVGFWAQPDNRIRGRVVDADGKIPKKVELVLINARPKDGDQTEPDEVAKEYFDPKNEWNKDGRFEFGWSDTLEPGEYLLGVNIIDTPDDDSPYAPTYYPGVKDRAQSTVLKVGLGTVIEDIVFQLPPKLRKHTIRGVIIWPDGRPVANAEVYLQDETRPDWSVNGFQQTDAQGRFTLTGYIGFNYEILAEAEKYPNAPEGKKQEMEAEPFKIKLTNDVAGIKIVLTKEKKKDE